MGPYLLRDLRTQRQPSINTDMLLTFYGYIITEFKLSSCADSKAVCRYAHLRANIRLPFVPSTDWAWVRCVLQLAQIIFHSVFFGPCLNHRWKYSSNTQRNFAKSNETRMRVVAQWHQTNFCVWKFKSQCCLTTRDYYLDDMRPTSHILISIKFYMHGITII